jgi:hypothetical protein
VTKTYKAIGYKDGYTDSAMVTAIYTIHFVALLPPPRPVTPPTFEPPNGHDLVFPVTVHISGDTSAIIIYTVDTASHPDPDPPSPTHGVQDGTSLDLVLTEDTTLRAICYRASDNRQSVCGWAFAPAALQRLILNA